jgi:hypothetical protein
MQYAETLTTLDPANRDILSAWVAAADRIDTVLDLSPRAWNVPGNRTIIGVFERGKPLASWLIVAEQSVWTLAACDDGAVSEPCTALAEILKVIDHRLTS